jgi:hypothetical protein
MPTYKLRRGKGPALDIIEVRCDTKLDATDLIDAYPALRWHTGPTGQQVAGQPCTVTKVRERGEYNDASDLSEVKVIELMCRDDPSNGDRRISDQAALDAMAYLFSATEWPGSSGLEDLCEIVAETGRTIEDDPEVDWARH